MPSPVATLAAVPVPADIQPALRVAASDTPVVYRNGCHLGFLATVPGQCTFGDPNGQHTMVLFGDSLAGQWFPALDAVAREVHWRLVSITKSACSAADVALWSGALRRAYTECGQWRRNALARIAMERPALIIVSDDRLYQLALNGGPVPVGQHVAEWNSGLVRTLESLRSSSSAVVVIAETPRSRVVPPACLLAHLRDAGACATPVAQAVDRRWLSAERTAAEQAGATFVDPSPWICPSDPCPAVIGHDLVYREQDHLTAVFAASLAPRLRAVLPLP